MPVIHRPIVRRLSLIALIAYWLLAAILTHLPASRIPAVHCSDKTLHMAGYFVLAALFILTARSYQITLRKRLIITALALMTYGILDETTQPLVNRHASVIDWLADCVGVIFAMAIDIILARFSPQNSNESMALEEAN